MKTGKMLVMVLTCGFISACGGGGGGGSSLPFYGGIWKFEGVKVVDDCQSGAPFATATTLTINQEDAHVVVDSGNVVLEGSVDTTNDGFLVVAEKASTVAGCSPNKFAYSFEDASDGNANVAVAIVTTCGNAQCSLAFSGTAVRQ